MALEGYSELTLKVFLTVTLQSKLLHQEAELENIGHVHANMVEEKQWLHL